MNDTFNSLDAFLSEHAGSEHMLPADERRKAQRYRINLPAICHLDGGGEIGVIVLDCSEGGFGLDRPLPLQRGERLHIALKDVGSFAAMLAWKSETRCGLQLLAGEDDMSSSSASELAVLLDQIAQGHDPLGDI